MTHTLRTSIACRSCSRGWWGTRSEKCSRCGGNVIITGQILVAPIEVAVR